MVCGVWHMSRQDGLVSSVSKQKVTIVYQQAKATYDDFVKVFAKIGYKIERK